MLKKILKERIAIIDGAMGTMIQSYDLKEKDYRSNRFKNHNKELIGNNDILCLTRPELISEIHGLFLHFLICLYPLAIFVVFVFSNCLCKNNVKWVGSGRGRLRPVQNDRTGCPGLLGLVLAKKSMN